MYQKYMNRILLGFLLPVIVSSVSIAQTKTKSAIRKKEIPNGVVYTISISSQQYKFDSAQYAVFIPSGVKNIQGIFIHQHGCLMEGRGASTAYDLQYQSFAKKWQLAIVGPDLYSAKLNCHAWKDPASGSAAALLQALKEIGLLSECRNLVEAPWLLWGHSGGGYWSQAMLAAFPERVMALFSYSPGLNASFDYPVKALKVPVMIRYAGEEGDACCWKAALTSFQQLRNKGGFAGIARNTFQNHNFSFVRYLAIPFFESVLQQRLPIKQGAGYASMRAIDSTFSWFGDTTSVNIYKANEYGGKTLAVSWFPDSLTAVKWREFVITGTIVDRTPPPAPYELKLYRLHNLTVELSWKADADIESGISHFNIYKDNHFIARFPTSGTYQQFDTNGDDAYPVIPLPLKMEISLHRNDTSKISVATVNQFGLESGRTTITKAEQ